jgi:hypothetical protein
VTQLEVDNWDQQQPTEFIGRMKIL